MKQSGVVAVVRAANTRPNWVGALAIKVIDGKAKTRDYVRASSGKLYRITRLEDVKGQRVSVLEKGVDGVFILEPDAPPPIVGLTSLRLNYEHEFVEGEQAKILGEA